MKKQTILLAAVLALVGCSSNSYLGNEDLNTPAATSDAITFSFQKSGVKKAPAGDLVGQDAADALHDQFLVYGTKTISGAASVVYPSWTVVYNGNNGSTETNTTGWDYVGTYNGEIQTVRYWDYNASEYNFVAWSLTTGNANVSATDDANLTVSGTAADLSKLYLSDRLTVSKSTTTSGVNTYGGIITLTFRNAATKVRLGLYEVVPGYTVSKVQFRIGTATTTSSNAKVAGKFVGGDMTASQSYAVTYATTAPYQAIMTPTAASGSAFTVNTEFDFGKFDQDAIGEANTDPTWAGTASDGYECVLPNEDAANIADMILYVDYTLTSTDHGTDVINVKGAKAIVPAAYMTWHPNYAYTYLFKISQNTNGTTGNFDPENPDDPTKNDPAGLYPITFDAVVAETEDAGTQGTTTTLTTPSITTYQNGSVVANGISYKAAENGTAPITSTVMYGTTDVTSATGTTITTFDLGTAAYNYNKTVQQNVANMTCWAGGTIATPQAGHTYVIAVTYTDGAKSFETSKVVVVE